MFFPTVFCCDFCKSIAAASGCFLLVVTQQQGSQCELAQPVHATTPASFKHLHISDNCTTAVMHVYVWSCKRQTWVPSLSISHRSMHMLLRIYSMACVCLSLCICVYVSSTAVDSSYIPVEREVKLMVNTSQHLQHVQQSQAAMLQAPPAVLRTNLVVVTGHPTW